MIHVANYSIQISYTYAIDPYGLSSDKSTISIHTYILYMLYMYWVPPLPPVSSQNLENKDPEGILPRKIFHPKELQA